MPTETNHYAVEILEIAVTRLDIFASSPELAAALIEQMDIRAQPAHFTHVSIKIEDAAEAAGETDENGQSGTDRCAAGQWQYDG